MDHLEIIRAIPEVALTLVGFTGIVFALRLRSTGSWSHKELAQLYAMVAPPLTAFFCAFAPDLFSSLLSSPDTIWRLSNATIGLIHLANILPFLVRMPSIQTTSGQKFLVVIGISLIAAHFLASLAWIPWQEFIFLLGLLQQIFVGMYNFYLLLSPTKGAT